MLRGGAGGGARPGGGAGRAAVGAAKVDITPADLTTLVPTGGTGPYGGGLDFDSVHDPLFGRVLVLESGGASVAIVSLDIIEVQDTSALRERIQRELGIAADHVMVAATHNHSAPRLAGGSPQLDAYRQATNDKIVAALKTAKAALQPARMGYGLGAADVSINSDAYIPPRGWVNGYNPDGRSDKTVKVMKFETLTGEPIAVLFNYAVHSIVTFNTMAISGDLAGVAEHVVERHYGDKAVALFTLSSAGDQNPKFSGYTLVPGGAAGSKDRAAALRTEAYPAMEAQGYMLGTEVIRVAGLIQARTTALRLGAAQSLINCPAKDLPKWAAFKETGVPIPLQVLLVDQIAFAGIGGEVVTSIYDHLRKDSPLANTVMVSLDNGRMGYLVDDAVYDTPNFHVNASPAVRGCAESGIVNGLVALIQAAAAPPPAPAPGKTRR